MTYRELGRLLSFHPVPASKERGVALGDGKFQLRSDNRLKKQVFRGRTFCGQLPAVLDI